LNSSVFESLKILAQKLLKIIENFEIFFWKFEEIDSQYLLVCIETLAKNIDKPVFNLEFKHNWQL
jgi:hypothetical protein